MDSIQGSGTLAERINSSTDSPSVHRNTMSDVNNRLASFYGMTVRELSPTDENEYTGYIIKSYNYPKPKFLSSFEDVLTLAKQGFYCNQEAKIACAAGCGYKNALRNRKAIPDIVAMQHDKKQLACSRISLVSDSEIQIRNWFKESDYSYETEPLITTV